jgi:sialate O-acetylesterase
MMPRPSSAPVSLIRRAAVLILLAAGVARADVTMPRIFGHHQVLQQGTNSQVWGWASPGEAVSVQLQGAQAQTSNATADGGGHWRVRLAGLTATTNVHALAVSGTNNTITLTNVVIGDVWLCAGQSNMDMGMYGVSNAAAELADAAYPFLRLFQVRPVATGVAQAVDIQFKPLDGAATNEGWSASRDGTVNLYSAVAFSFARALHKTNGTPIGLIQVSVGATGCDQYTDPQAYLDDPRFGATNGYTRTNYYNGSIAPITNLAIRGALWYQGEHEGSAAVGAYRYRDQLDVLLKSWRAAFPVGDFPFIAIQLHNWGAQDSTRHWDELRESQSTVLLTNHTALVVGVDVGDPLNLHPANKIPLGERAALAARALAYGETNLVYQGPVLAAQQVAGTNVILTFTSVGTGLVIRGGAGPLQGFMIAGGNSNYVQATAAILSSNQVVVNSPRIASPVAVRYGWYFNPQDANLGNSAGLPANVFRTDTFGLFSGGPDKLGDLSFRGDVARITNEAGAVYRGDLRRTGVYADRAPTLLTNLVWSFATGARVRSTVAVRDGAVVFSSQNTNIYAVALTNGGPLWQFNAGHSGFALALNQTSDFAGAPVFADGVVMMPMKDKLIVLDPKDGSYRYSFEAQPAYADGDDRVASPAVVDGTALFGGVARLYGLDPRSGNVKVHRTLHWNGQSPAFTRSAASIEDGIAYFTEPTFFSINLTNLAVAGLSINDDAMNTNPAPAAVAPCAALSAGSAVFTRSNRVVSVDLATRATNWTFVGADRFDSSPAVFRGRVYVGCNDGNLYALDLATGASNWTFATGGAVKSSPAVANSLIYFGSGDGKVYAVDEAGLLASSYQTGGPVHGSPVIRDGVVLVGSDDGAVYALGGDDTTPPVLLSAVVLTGTVIELVFNEPLLGSTVTPSAHYQLTGGGAVTQAVLSPDLRTVTLATLPLATGQVYTLTVTNVADLAGNPVAAGTQTDLLYTVTLPVYAVVYQGNGNTGGSAPTDTNAYTAGQSVTVLGNTGGLYRIGHVFSGWNTAAGGAGTAYAAGQSFSMPDSNLVLYASWGSNVSAGLIAYEGFDLAEGENALVGTSGGAASTGWSGIWTNTTVDVAAGLSYGSLVVTGGAARLDGAGSGAFRALATPFNTGTVWIGVLGVVTSGASYAGVSLFNNFNNERVFLGDTSVGTGWGFHPTGLGPAYMSGSNVADVAFLVLRIDWNVGATNNEQVFFWVNPALDVEPSVTNTAVAIPELNLNPAGGGELLGRVRLQQGGSGDNAVFDELRVGRSWADVAPTSGLSADADGDGMPDAWELQELGSTTHGADADFDGDGASNLAEYIADTNPSNHLSRLKLDALRLRVDGNLLDVSVAGRSNRNYGLWRATNVWSAGAAWEPVAYQGPLNVHSNIVLVETNQPVRDAWYQVRVSLP